VVTGDAAFGLLEVAGIEGLDAWLTSFSLDRYLPDTILWCYEEGVSSLQEVFKNWEQLADALNLKRLGRTRMSQDPRCPARAEFPPGSLPMHPAVIPPGSLPQSCGMMMIGGVSLGILVLVTSMTFMTAILGMTTIPGMALILEMAMIMTLTNPRYDYIRSLGLSSG